MRNEFRGNLILGALKNKKLLRPQKKPFLLLFLDFRETFFSHFRNFVIKFYIKICLVIIMIFLFSSNKKQNKKKKKKQKKTEQEKFIT